MITKNDAKFIKSLQLKKFRERDQAFVVEGGKNVIELLKSKFTIVKLLVTNEFLASHANLIDACNVNPDVVTEKQLVSIGTFRSNNMALAVGRIPEVVGKPRTSDFVLAFESLQDPGNLGTIIRTADWYGFDQIVCSLDSVDIFNPKTLASTMGSYTRVKVFYLDLDRWIVESGLDVYGTVLEGISVHNTDFKDRGIILFGNESSGISTSFERQLKYRVHIPGYGGAESLNVGIATGIICDNLRRLTKK